MAGCSRTIAAITAEAGRDDALTGREEPELGTFVLDLLSQTWRLDMLAVALR